MPVDHPRILPRRRVVRRSLLRHEHGQAPLAHVNAHTVLLGCNGVDAAAGITNVNLPEADVKRRLLAAGRRRIVLADGSKLGAVHLARLCGTEDVDVVITGPSADPSVVDDLRQHEIEVILAE